MIYPRRGICMFWRTSIAVQVISFPSVQIAICNHALDTVIQLI